MVPRCTCNTPHAHTHHPPVSLDEFLQCVWVLQLGLSIQHKVILAFLLQARLSARNTSTGCKSIWGDVYRVPSSVKIHLGPQNMKVAVTLQSYMSARNSISPQNNMFNCSFILNNVF